MTTDLRALVEKWRAIVAGYDGTFRSEYDPDAAWSDAHENCADELQAALDAQAGIVMVPHDPTPEMIEAGIMFGTSPNKVCIIYQSMVNAAPAGPVEGGEG